MLFRSNRAYEVERPFLDEPLALLSDESQDCLISLVKPVNASFWSLTVAVGRKTWTRVFDGPFEQTAEWMTAAFALEAPTQPELH